MKVKLSLTQVIDGIEYTGKLIACDIETTWNLRFSVHIDQLDSQPEPKEGEEKECARRLFMFTLTRDEKPLAIDDQTFGFILVTVGQSVIEFYYNSLTRNANEGPLRNVARLHNATVKLEKESTYAVPDEEVPTVLLNAA